ncbi:DNA-binding transcriptional MocR family regulator [Nakamurella sp. UYEF19]|uniref:aminotransferase-like domain-containing protein n=1 Tax=Nakamurella sp. UYEF19 TaxID=1756392 RepID=UPI0033910FDB
MSNDSSVQRVVRRIDDLAREAPAGTRLPSSRELVASLGVSATTVQQAIARLSADGTITTRPGAGTFVAERRAPVRADTTWQDVTLSQSLVDTAGLDDVLRSSDPGVLPMAVGYPSAQLGGDLGLSPALARASRRPGVWEPPPADGLPELRTWFGQQIGVAGDDVIISPGTQSALSTIFRALVPGGESILFATPTYPGALAVARSAGLVPVPIPGDENGIRPDLLERALERTHARLLYVQPTYANPDGSVLNDERRRELLEIAHRHGLFVVEDDWARWLGHGDPVPRSLISDDEHGHVITVCSLTKAGAPGLRIGAIAARGRVAGRLAALRMVDDFFVSGPLQHAAVDIVTATAWSTHVRRTAIALGGRARVLVRELRATMPDCAFVPPAGGLSLWLELPDALDEAVCVRTALDHGVAVAPGRYYSIGDQRAPHLRLSFANLTEDELPEAVRRLATALGEVGQPRPLR